MQHISLLGKLAAGSRALGLGSLLSLVRNSADQICMRSGYLPLRITVNGFNIAGFCRHRSFLAGLLDNYEPFFRQLFKESLKPGMVVVDGGSHIGLYSLIASRKLGAGGKVLAFEPDPHSFRALLSNFKINHCHNVIAFQRALSSSEGRTRLYQCPGTISSSLFKRPHFDAGSMRQVDVKTTTLDLELRSSNLDAILVKLDLEGAEILALQGARETFKRVSSATVFVEVNPSALEAAGFRPRTLVDELQQLGLELFFIDEDSRTLIPLSQLSTLRKGNLLGRKTLQGTP